MVTDTEPTEETSVGDGRKKHITVVHPSGEQTEHGDVYVKHSSKAFLVSPDADFPEAETTRYEKNDLLRTEISQHHAACFITTAAAGDERTLDDLRAFRDRSMARDPIGRALLSVYETVSPPIARILDRHSTARTTGLVRWLVERCATVARRQRRASGWRARVLAVGLTGLYVVGLVVSIVGAAFLRARDLTG